MTPDELRQMIAGEERTISEWSSSLRPQTTSAQRLAAYKLALANLETQAWAEAGQHGDEARICNAAWSTVLRRLRA